MCSSGVVNHKKKFKQNILWKIRKFYFFFFCDAAQSFRQCSRRWTVKEYVTINAIWKYLWIKFVCCGYESFECVCVPLQVLLYGSSVIAIVISLISLLYSIHSQFDVPALYVYWNLAPNIYCVQATTLQTQNAKMCCCATIALSLSRC